MKTVYRYMPIITGNEKEFDSIIFTQTYPPEVPYWLLKISVIGIEKRTLEQRIDPTAKRREKVEKIKEAIKNFWNAIKS